MKFFSIQVLLVRIKGRYLHSQTDRTEPGGKEKEGGEKEFEINFAKSFGIGEMIAYLCTPNRKEGEKFETKT